MIEHRLAHTFGAILAATALVAGLSGCERETTPRISVVLPATGTEFAAELRAGAEAAARDYEGQIQLKIVGPAQIDPAEEIKAFQNEAATVPDAIIVGPVPSSLFAEPALQAQMAGTKVAWIVSPPPPEVTDAIFIGQREYDLGKRIGDLIADNIIAKKGKDVAGTIVLGICVPGMENLEDRLLGARTALAAKLPNVKIPATIADGNERAANFAVWQQAVAANPNGLAFVSMCEPGMVNLAKIKEDDKRDFELAVFDTPEQVRSSIKKGTISAAAPPSHFLSAYMSVSTVAKALLAKQDLPNGWLEMPITVIDSSNIDAFDAAQASPATMEAYFKSEVDRLKALPTTNLPPVKAARP